MSGISTTQEVFAVGVLAFAIIAFVTTIPGWLTNRPDSSRRFFWRFISTVALLGVWMSLWGSDQNHSWWKWILFLLGFFYFMDRISFWYRKMEQYRKIERVLPSWREYGKNGWTP